MTYKGITRLDIAYDTDIDVLKKFKRLYNQLNRYSYKNRGKTTVNGTGLYDTQINIGSLRSQGKTVIIYDKSTLLRQQSKDYLSALYEALFGHKDIFRVEVRITSKTTGKYDIELFKLGDKKFLETIFNCFGESLLDFRYKQTNSNTTRQTKTNFLDLNHTGEELTKKISIRTIKGDNSMKYLIWKLHCDRKKEEFSSISREIKMIEALYVKLSGLKDWLKKKEMREK